MQKHPPPRIYDPRFEIQELRKANAQLVNKNQQLVTCIRDLNKAYLLKVRILEESIQELKAKTVPTQDQSAFRTRIIELQRLLKSKDQQLDIKQQEIRNVKLALQTYQDQNTTFKQTVKKMEEEALATELKLYELRFELEAYENGKNSHSSDGSAGKSTLSDDASAESSNQVQCAAFGSAFADIINVPSRDQNLVTLKSNKFNEAI